MSLDRELHDQLIQCPQKDIKMVHQQSSKNNVTQTSPTAPLFDFQSCLQSSTETSFDTFMHEQNLENLKTAVERMMEDCLESYDKNKGFEMLMGGKFQQKIENQLEMLVINNQLLGQEMIRQLCVLLEAEDGLLGLLKELPRHFPMVIGKQIVYILTRILQQKMQGYKQLFKSKELNIPKFSCFQDCLDDILTKTGSSCPVFEDVPVEDIVEFAEKGMDEFAYKVYFSEVKILNLRKVEAEKKEVDVVAKFAKVVRQLSKCVFLGLTGAVEPPVSTCLDFSRQISLTSFSDMGMSNQRSLSRALVMYQDGEESNYNFISKKIKFQ